MAKVALYFVDLLSSQHFKHQYVSTGWETDNGVEGGGVRSHRKLNSLCRKCVPHMPIIDLGGQERKKITEIKGLIINSVRYRTRQQ